MICDTVVDKVVMLIDFVASVCAETVFWGVVSDLTVGRLCFPAKSKRGQEEVGSPTFEGVACVLPAGRCATLRYALVCACVKC